MPENQQPEAVLTPAASANPPQTLAAAVIRLANVLLADIHVNASGLVFFIALAYGVIHPEVQAQCKDICVLAGIYLFPSAKAK